MNKYQKKDIENSASAYCVSVMFFIALAICALIGCGILLIHYRFHDYFGIGFYIYMVLILLLNLQVFAPYFLLRGLVKPIEQINEATKKMSSGDLNIQTTYCGKINEIKSVFDNFNIMVKELSEISTLRSDFTSNVSHEFKTPLASIEGYTMYLQTPDITEEERQDCIDHILKNIKKLSNLTGDILMLSKLENSHLNPEITAYRLDEQIRQSLLLQENIWEAKNIKFDLQLEDITYSGAKLLLEHVWSNLINNSVKYSNQDGNIRIWLYKKNFDIIFEIEDHGIGISKKAQRHIFDKFYQADTPHKSEGSGLGLAQVKEIIRLTGNEISVKSQKGIGSTFTVTLHENR